MKSLRSVTDIMTSNCYTATIDIKDAYYSVLTAAEHQKYLKFAGGDTLYNILGHQMLIISTHDFYQDNNIKGKVSGL